MDSQDAASAGEGPDLRRYAPPLVSESDFVSGCYNMERPERGMAIIINNRRFHPRTNMGERKGTDVDAHNMGSLFTNLNFEKIQPYDDLKAGQIKDVLTKAARDDHTNRDCFVCVILSHGDEGYIFGTDDKVPIEELLRPFKGHNCPSLAGKPKLFFIQACRGQEELERGTNESDGPTGSTEAEDEIVVRRIPSEADFLMAYSVVPGCLSWCHPGRGSWFIQAIHHVFMNHWQTLDVMTMMTRVKRRVARDFEANANAEYMRRRKHIPCVTSMLTKDLFFK